MYYDDDRIEAKDKLLTTILNCGLAELYILDEIAIDWEAVDILNMKGEISLENIFRNSFYAFRDKSDIISNRRDFLINSLINNYDEIETYLTNYYAGTKLKKHLEIEDDEEIMEIVNVLKNKQHGSVTETLDYYIDQLKKYNISDFFNIYFNYIATEIIISNEVNHLLDFYTDAIEDFSDAFGWTIEY